MPAKGSSVCFGALQTSPVNIHSADEPKLRTWIVELGEVTARKIGCGVPPMIQKLIRSE